MFSCLESLTTPLLAARLLREGILASPLPPPQRRSVRARVWAENSRAPLTEEALRIALVIGGREDPPIVTPEDLEALAAACGDGRLRAGAGRPFHGRPAPARRGVRVLVTESLETINGPVALEVWSPVVRAFALHFLLRLVQPFACDPAALAAAAEAALLAADGYAATALLLPDPSAVGTPEGEHPDPDAFAMARASALVTSLGTTQEWVQDASAHAHLDAWAGERGAGLGKRQVEFLRFLVARPAVTVAFEEYVGLHAGRGAPSLRSLQRDWKGLLDAGWLVATPTGAVRLSTEPLMYERGQGDEARQG